MHLHGALGVSNEMPFGSMWSGVPIMAVGRRPERGAQGHRGQGSAQGLQAGRRPVAVGVAPGQAGRGPQEDRQHARAHDREFLSDADRQRLGRVRRRDRGRPGGPPGWRDRGDAPRRVRRGGVRRHAGRPAATRRSAVALREPHQADGPGARRVWCDDLASPPTWSSSTSRRASSRRAGLDGERLRAHNASLVHGGCHRTRPWADRRPPADELLLWAWTGLAAQQPGATSDHPVASVVPIITYEQGALGADRDRGRTDRAATRGAVRSLTVSGSTR